MRLIFINRYVYPDQSATSVMLSDLAFGLVAGGHLVSVIASRQLYDSPSARLPALEHVDGLEIRRVWSTRFGRAGLIGRAIDYLSFHVAAALAVSRLAGQGDVVIAKTDPPLLSLPIGPIARFTGAHPVNWLQDIFPEIATALGVGGRSGGLGFAVLRRLRNRSLARAAMNVVIGERARERLRAEGIPADRIRVIPNWANTRIEPVPPDCNRLRRDWGLEGRFVVGYSGNLGRVHELETMLGAIEGLSRDERLKVRFVVIGNGAQRPRLEAEIARRGLRNVVLEPYQPAERLAESISAADVHLVTLKPELEGLVVPSKVYAAAAAGRPVLFVGDADGEVARLVRAEGFGLAVGSGDVPGLIAAIGRLASDAGLCREMGERARSWALRRHSPGLALEAWSRLLDEIASARTDIPAAAAHEATVCAEDQLSRADRAAEAGVVSWPRS